MKKVSYYSVGYSVVIFAALLAVQVLTSCGRGGQNSSQSYNQMQGPAVSSAVIVRVNQNNPADVQYINTNSAPAQENLQQFAHNQQNWQTVANNQVITPNQGYPQANQGAYFVQQPKDFVKQNNGAASAAYYGGGRGYGGCGYCGYPNYYGYGNAYNHYYNPTYFNYGLYNYLPTYYTNYSYWYYQPLYYTPSYYGYNYYVYSTWW